MFGKHKFFQICRGNGKSAVMAIIRYRSINHAISKLTDRIVEAEKTRDMLCEERAKLEAKYGDLLQGESK